MGKLMLERWFLRPLLNVADINQRLDAVQTFASLDVHAGERLASYLKYIKNIPAILRKLMTKASHTEVGRR
jgi:DNA mismatch repair ATPase MutS